jgi:hypothetical protein
LGVHLAILVAAGMPDPLTKYRRAMKILTFDESLTIARTARGKCHVLLGNGFSRALFDKVFNYTALFERAKAKLSPTAARAFAALGTTHFEEVMRALRHASSLVDIYATSAPDVAKAMEADLDAIRDLLAATIADSHPDRPASIKPEQYASCKLFLEHFDCIYTCNYDLLVYWTLMQDEIPPKMQHDDGFRNPDDPDMPYVVWEVQNTDDQNIHYLHGALHIYDAGHELQKYTWIKTQIPLIDQIRTALKEDKYPLFVSEGTWQEKLERIQHSNYLGRSYRSFAKIGGCLFIYGLSLAPNDEHILTLLDDNKITNVFVGIFGDPSADWNRTMVERAKQLGSNRPKSRPIVIHFYDAASAQVWNRPPLSKKGKRLG